MLLRAVVLLDDDRRGEEEEGNCNSFLPLDNKITLGQ
jgi:hypothetical protein